MANIFKAKTLVGRTGIFSHEVAAPNLVYNTGNQTILGNKTFINNIEVQGTGIFNSVDLSNISEFQFSGVTMDLIDTNTYVSGGWIYISGNPVLTGVDLSPYATTTNLALTGSSLNIKINNLSGYINSADSKIVFTTGNQIISGDKTFVNNINISGTGVFNNLNLNSISSLNISGVDIYITDGLIYSNSPAYATNLVYNTGSQDIAGNKNFYSRPTVNGTGVLLTGEFLNYLPGTIVYTTGNQTISGLKDFDARPTVNTIPVLLSGENANGLTVLVKNDEPAELLKGQPVYIYGADGNNILVRKASNTGEAYSSKTLGLLAQDLNSNAQGFVITEGALEGLDTNAGNAGDPVWLGPTGNLIFGLTNKPYAPNHLVYLGVVERKQQNNGKIYVKIQNGFELEELHNVNINHSYPLNNQDIMRYDSVSGLWFNQPLNTGIFENKINSLSGVSVLTFGNQTINGLKTFTSGIDIYSGTSSQSFRVFNRTGLNSGEYGIFGWKNNELIFGPERTNSGILRDLTLTGRNININASGVFNIFDPTNINGNLNITGNVNVTGNINNIGTGRFSAVDLNDIDTFSISGVEISINNCPINIVGTSRPTFNGTGILLSGDITNIVFTTGNQLINGTKTFNSGVVINIQPTGTNPVLNITGTWNNASQLYTGIALDIVDTNSDTNSSLINLQVGGASRFRVRKNGWTYIGTYLDMGGVGGIENISNTYTFYNNSINMNTSTAGLFFRNGNTRLFSDADNRLDLRNGLNPQQFRIYNSTGTNSGEFGLVGWINSGFVVGPQQTSDGILRDLTLTGNNININASGVFNIFDNTNIVGNLTVSGNMLLSGILTTNQRPTVNGTGVLLSGEAAQVDLTSTVRTTGNQTISGIKDFQSAPLVSGKEIYFQKNTVYFTGNAFTPDYISGRNFVYQLTGYATVYNNLNDPINMPEGETVLIKVIQSNYGNNYMLFGSNYRFPGDASPILTQGSGKTDIFNILKLDNRFYTTYIKNFSN